MLKNDLLCGIQIYWYTEYEMIEILDSYDVGCMLNTKYSLKLFISHQMMGYLHLFHALTRMIMHN